MEVFSECGEAGHVFHQEDARLGLKHRPNELRKEVSRVVAAPAETTCAEGLTWRTASQKVNTTPAAEVDPGDVGLEKFSPWKRSAVSGGCIGPDLNSADCLEAGGMQPDAQPAGTAEKVKRRQMPHDGLPYLRALKERTWNNASGSI